MKGFSIIVAFDEVRGIGKGGVLPWHLPADLAHFKNITTEKYGHEKNAVIMGRKTWESIPERFRPLPGRLNVVLTGNEHFNLPNDVERFSSFQGAMERFFSQRGQGDEFKGEVFIIGGAKLFAEAIKHPLCERLYLTLIEGSFGADVFFPEIPKSFVETSRSGKFQENEKSFSFIVLSKRT